MFFRLPYTLKPMDMGDKDVLEFIVKNETGDVFIEVRKVTEDQSDKRYSEGEIAAIAFTDRTISEK